MKIKAQEFRDVILGELEKMFNKTLSRAAPGIVKDIRDIVRYELLNTKEVASMLGGDLRGELGFIKGQETSYIYPVINYLVEHITYELKDVEFIGVAKPLKIRLLNLNLEDLTSLPLAEYESEDGPVKWLEWILTKGDRIIIKDHRIQYKFNDKIRSKKVNHPLPVSRSGLAIMVKQVRKGRGYKIPAEYSGTTERNFITDVFNIVLFRIQEVMIRNILLNKG